MRVKVYSFEVPGWLRRASIVGVAAAVLLVWDAASGGVPNTFKDGDVLTAQALNDNFAATGIPAGTIVAFAGDSAPQGWVVCDGAELDRAAFTPLFQAIGTSWGSATSTKFNVPDLRGSFLRGLSENSPNDPDCAARVVQATGGNTGCKVGTKQGDAMLTHSHTLTIPTSLLINGYSSGSGTSFYGAGTSTPQTNTPSTSNVGGSTETRPKNVAVKFIIKT